MDNYFRISVWEMLGDLHEVFELVFFDLTRMVQVILVKFSPGLQRKLSF